MKRTKKTKQPAPRFYAAGTPREVAQNRAKLLRYLRRCEKQVFWGADRLQRLILQIESADRGFTGLAALLALQSATALPCEIFERIEREARPAMDAAHELFFPLNRSGGWSTLEEGPLPPIAAAPVVPTFNVLDEATAIATAARKQRDEEKVDVRLSPSDETEDCEDDEDDEHDEHDDDGEKEFA